VGVVGANREASLVQWLEYLPSKQMAGVRFPDDALFSKPGAGVRVEGSGGLGLSIGTHGLVGYDDCFTCSRSPVRSRVGVESVFGSVVC
jgi:hypothetical protein